MVEISYAQKQVSFEYHKIAMRMKGLEPSRPKTLEPKSSASTNSATSAKIATITIITDKSNF